MSQFLSRTLIHKIVDKIMPNNCRLNLAKALEQNKTASTGLVYYLNQNEKEVIAALKNDRRTKARV